MAKYVGGDILELTATHPTLGDFRYQVKANEDFTIDPGGIRNADDQNNVTGNGTFIQQKNMAVWSIEGVVMVDFASGNEVESLKAQAASPDLSVWTVSHISGAIWKGTGTIVGDIQPGSNNAQVSIKIAGSGSLEKIS